MKKILIILGISVVSSISVYASCPIDEGVCSASSVWDRTPIQQKYLPDRLQDIQKSDAFRPNYIQPYDDMMLNTEGESVNSSLPQTRDYNSNCQFGVCLPEQSTGAGANIGE